MGTRTPKLNRGLVEIRRNWEITIWLSATLVSAQAVGKYKLIEGRSIFYFGISIQHESRMAFRIHARFMGCQGSTKDFDRGRSNLCC